MESPVLRLNTAGVAPSLQAIQQIKDDLQTHKQTLVAKLQAAEAGDPCGYLTAGVQQGYAAVNASTTAIALLDDLLHNSRATIQTLEQHDQQTHAPVPKIQQPLALQVTNAHDGISSIVVTRPPVERPEITVQPAPAAGTVTPQLEPRVQEQVAVQQTNTLNATLTGIASVPPLTAPLCSATAIPPMIPEAAYAVPETDSSWWDSVTGFFGNLWDGLRGTFDGLKAWFAENFGAIKELAVKYYQALKDGNILAWLGLFVIVGIGILALIGVGVVVVALKFIVLAAVVIGAIVGVALIGYNIYQMIANPDLSPYERGKLLGTSIGELIFLLPAGVIKAPRLVGLFDKAGRLFKPSKLGSIVSKGGVLLRFNKISKVREGIRLLSTVRKPADLRIIRRFSTLEQAAEYTRYFDSFDAAAQFVTTVGDAEKSLVMLRRAGSYEKVAHYSSKISTMDDLAYLIELPDDLLDAMHVQDIKPTVEALKKWNVNGQGANQGIEHIILYARGTGGTNKQHRLSSLNDVMRWGPFSDTDPKTIADVTMSLIDYIQSAPPIQYHRTINSYKEVFFIPSVDTTSKYGILIRVYDGKISSFHRLKTKNFATVK